MHRDVFRERVPGMCTKDLDRSMPSGAGAGMFALSCMLSRLETFVSVLGTVLSFPTQTPFVRVRFATRNGTS